MDLYVLVLLMWLKCTYSTTQKPNIIFVLGDDIGYDDIGYQSGTIHTPTLDKLIANGQFINWHYAEPVCSPTRGALLTGLYPLHNGINTVLVPDNTCYVIPDTFISYI